DQTDAARMDPVVVPLVDFLIKNVSRGRVAAYIEAQLIHRVDANRHRQWNLRARSILTVDHRPANQRDLRVQTGFQDFELHHIVVLRVVGAINNAHALRFDLALQFDAIVRQLHGRPINRDLARALDSGRFAGEVRTPAALSDKHSWPGDFDAGILAGG